MTSARLAAVKRGCMRLGTVATGSLLLSLLVMMLVADAPQIGRWFLASAALAALAYGTAIVAAYFEP